MQYMLIISLLALLSLVSIAQSQTITVFSNTTRTDQTALLTTLNYHKCIYQQNETTFFLNYSQCLQRHASTHASQMNERGTLIAMYEGANKEICDGSKFISVVISSTSTTSTINQVLDGLLTKKTTEFDYTDLDNQNTLFITALLWKSNNAVACARDGKFISCLVSPKVNGVLSMMNYKDNFLQQMNDKNVTQENTSSCTALVEQPALIDKYIYSTSETPTPTTPIKDSTDPKNPTATPTIPDTSNNGGSTNSTNGGILGDPISTNPKNVNPGEVPSSAHQFCFVSITLVSTIAFILI